MRSDRLSTSDDEAFCHQRLDADVENPSLDRSLDLRLRQPLEHLEQQVLERDRQSEDAVEEGRRIAGRPRRAAGKTSARIGFVELEVLLE